MKISLSFLVKLVSVRTNGAVALTGHKKDFEAEEKQIGPQVNFVYCIVYRGTVRDQSRFCTVPQDNIKDLNFAKARTLISGVFEVQCEECS
jgi:hypothetical protein